MLEKKCGYNRSLKGAVMITDQKTKETNNNYYLASCQVCNWVKLSNEETDSHFILL